MKKISLLLLCLCLLPQMAWAQLTEDQDLLLADLQAAFQQREGWSDYALTYERREDLGWTVFSPRSNQWLSRTDDLSFSGQLEAETMTGELERSITQLDSSFAQTDAQIETRSIEGDAETLADEDYYPFLADLFGEDKQPIPADLLENVTAIYDLGIVKRVQGYEVILDFAESLPDLSFNADEFLGQFNGTVELGFLRDSLAESSTLTLYAYFDSQTGQILDLRLILEITLEVSGEAVVAVAEGDGIFSVDYGLSWSLNYGR